MVAIVETEAGDLYERSSPVSYRLPLFARTVWLLWGTGEFAVGR